MGHRALVAYRRPDRLYDVRYSHWGGEDLSLADRITESTPLAEGVVDATVLAGSIARDRILVDLLDPCVHEALYLVSPDDDYTVDVYRVCWLEWGDGRDDGRGAIVRADPARDGEIRAWFRAVKTTLGDAIEMGALSRRAAQAYLESRICEDEDGIVYTFGNGQQHGESLPYTPRPDVWLAEDGRREDATGRTDDDRDRDRDGDENRE
ncbi:DUF6735 family protein [Natrialba sp. INN-245]|uniref:DUF6735 family protein n=1 Tax=Natrialba sp. INN-245 TaxID=2690967 RepID=UPI0013131A04|nr:DUF6735 family protein [Natrialba sp. INN-245]MWV39837.1 hypothetical protein [Natrialba sp. INN-245]